MWRFMAAIALVGCAPTITREQIEDFEAADRDERAAVVARPGLEDGVAVVRSAKDRLLGAWKKAVK